MRKSNSWKMMFLGGNSSWSIKTLFFKIVGARKRKLVLGDKYYWRGYYIPKNQAKKCRAYETMTMWKLRKNCAKWFERLIENNHFSPIFRE